MHAGNKKEADIAEDDIIEDLDNDIDSTIDNISGEMS